MEEANYVKLKAAVQQTKETWEGVKDEKELPEEIKAEAYQTWVEAIRALQNAQKEGIKNID